MSIAIRKHIPTSDIEGDIKYSYHEQRIPSFEVSLLAPNNHEDVSAVSNVQVIQSAAVVSVIASQNTSPNQSNNGGTLFDSSQASQNPGVVPSHPVEYSRSPNSRSEQRDFTNYHGVIFQDHNYGAPMPITSPAIPFTPPATSCPDDDLPKLIVPIIAQPVKSIEQPVASTTPESCTAPPSSVANPPPQKLTKKQKELISYNSCNHYDNNNIEKPKYGGTRCVCGYLHDDGYMIQCECCTAWQHVVCYGLSKESLKKSYFCETCDPRDVNRSRAVSIQERKIKRGVVKSVQNASKKPVKKKMPDKKPPSKQKAASAPKVLPEPPAVVESSVPLTDRKDTSLPSREERKLMAIMKRFEQMEKRNLADEEVPSKKAALEQNSVSPPKNQQAGNASKTKVITSRKSAVMKKRQKQKPGLATMLKKKSQKAANKVVSGKSRTMMAAVNQKAGKTTPSSTPRSVFISKKEKAKKSPSKTHLKTSKELNSADTGKKRWLSVSSPEDTSVTTQPNVLTSPSATAFEILQASLDAKCSDGYLNDSYCAMNVRDNSLFEPRICDSTPSAISPPVSPEPVLAPLKKRYVRAESQSSPAVETPAVSAPPPSSLLGSGGNDLMVSPTVIPPHTTNDSAVPDLESKYSRPVEPIREQTEPKVVVQSPISGVSTQVPCKVEPPAKRKVSLKEYKERIRESCDQSKGGVKNDEVPVTSIKNEEESTETAGASSTFPPVPVEPDVVSDKKPAQNSVLLDIDNDETDAILVTPLPSDFHLAGGYDESNRNIADRFSPNGDHRSSSKGYGRLHSSRRHHSTHRHHHQPQVEVGSDLRVIIPTKAERVAKLKRVDRWLDDVLKIGDDSNSTASNGEDDSMFRDAVQQNLVKCDGGRAEHGEVQRMGATTISTVTDDMNSGSSAPHSPFGLASTSNHGGH